MLIQETRSGPDVLLKLFDEAGRLCGFDLTTATVEDRKLLEPLTRWMRDGIIVGDGGYLSRARARELGARGV